MDDETIKRILPILASADGGCSVCGPSLIHDFMVEFGVPRERIIALFGECGIGVYWAKDLEETLAHMSAG